MFISVRLERYVSKYVNRFELYLVWNKCILNISMDERKKKKKERNERKLKILFI